MNHCWICDIKSDDLIFIGLHRWACDEHTIKKVNEAVVRGEKYIKPNA